MAGRACCREWGGARVLRLQSSTTGPSMAKSAGQALRWLGPQPSGLRGCGAGNGCLSALGPRSVPGLWRGVRHCGALLAHTRATQEANICTSDFLRFSKHEKNHLNQVKFENNFTSGKLRKNYQILICSVFTFYFFQETKA